MIDNLVKLSIDNGGSISPSIIPGNLTDGTGLCNSSIFIDDNGDILLNIRHVHYLLYHSEFEQKYYSGWGCLAYLNPEDDISLKTGNYLCKLDPDTLYVKEFKKVDTSKHDIEPNWEFIGLEDARVVRWNNKLYISGVRRDIIDDGEGRMELCEIEWNENSIKEVTRDRILPPKSSYLEKNWMPILDMPYHYVKWSNPLEIVKVDPNTKKTQSAPKGDITTIPSKSVINKSFTIYGIRDQRGGSQVIPFQEGRVAILHECDFFYNDNNKKDSHYYHRFIFWDKDWNVTKISKPFKFMDTQIEFCVGLAQNGDDFLISFGYQDNASYVLKMPTKTLNYLEYENLDSYIKFDCKYPEFSWENNELYLSKIINEEIFVNNIYQKHFKVKEGDTVMDIGANVGAFSFSALKQNIKQLYAIEPSSILLPTLKKNLKSNIKVDIINSRIGDKEETNQILTKEDGINIYDNANSLYSTTTFSQLIKDYKIENIDFLKCDCEGGEYSVFNKENQKWILENVKKIAGEFHLWGVPSALDNFYIFRDLYLTDKVKYIVEDRNGNDVTLHMKDNVWLKDFSWGKQNSAQLNVYIINENRW